jgi:hypothetical protein
MDIDDDNWGSLVNLEDTHSPLSQGDLSTGQSLPFRHTPTDSELHLPLGSDGFSASVLPGESDTRLGQTDEPQRSTHIGNTNDSNKPSTEPLLPTPSVVPKTAPNPTRRSRWKTLEPIRSP